MYYYAVSALLVFAFGPPPCPLFLWRRSWTRILILIFYWSLFHWSTTYWPRASPQSSLPRKLQQTTSVILNVTPRYYNRHPTYLHPFLPSVSPWILLAIYTWAWLMFTSLRFFIICGSSVFNCIYLILDSVGVGISRNKVRIDSRILWFPCLTRVLCPPTMNQDPSNRHLLSNSSGRFQNLPFISLFLTNGLQLHRAVNKCSRIYYFLYHYYKIAVTDPFTGPPSPSPSKKTRPTLWLGNTMEICTNLDIVLYSYGIWLWYSVEDLFASKGVLSTGAAGGTSSSDRMRPEITGRWCLLDMDMS